MHSSAGPEKRRARCEQPALIENVRQGAAPQGLDPGPAWLTLGRFGKRPEMRDFHRGMGRWAIFSSGWVSEWRRKGLDQNLSSVGRVVSLVVGVLVAAVLIIGMFLLLVSQKL
jgi:hypothetical protein